MPPSVRLSVMIPVVLHDRVREASRAEGESMSTVVRVALAEFLRSRNLEPTRRLPGEQELFE